MRKLKTDIKGFDALFHGGIQVDNLTSTDGARNDSIVIVIRGERGTHKQVLAMQLMHGLTKSIKKRLVEKLNKPVEDCQSRFYSINKSVHVLNDMFLDILIRRWIDLMICAIKRKEVNWEQEDEERPVLSSLDNQRLKALKFWFNTDFNDSVYESPTESRKQIYRTYEKELVAMMAENMIYYNPRTNSIHFRTLTQGDSSKNLLLKRRRDTIDAYINDFKSSLYDLRSYEETSECYHLEDELVKIEFKDINSKNDCLIERNSKEATLKFFDILHDIESEDSTLKADNPAVNVDKKPFEYEVLVIDGFSYIDSKSLKALPYNHLQSELRKRSRISILVFDNRQEVNCDGDIVIDLRKSYDETEKYTYSEIQISKCTFQTHALGWHQYKVKDDGIVVFPSLHLLLTKRHYITNKSHDIGKSVLDLTYDQFFESKLHSDNASGLLGKMANNDPDMENYANQFHYSDFKEQLNASKGDFLDKIIKPQLKLREIEDSDSNHSADRKYSIGNEQENQILHNSLFGTKDLNRQSSEIPFGWMDHYASTAIVGNPNSYKRKLILGHAFYWARQKEHVLFVLFDKNEEDIRRIMACPGLGNHQFDKNDDSCDCRKKRCLECYRYIHFFRVRSGCITPEEFFAALLEQINVYCDEDPLYGIERRRLHIIIDDFQRIDFCFPFIRRSSLFTDALINLCHQHNVELSLLCDKSCERAREICTLVDNVICVERNQSDVNRIKIYVERTSIPPFPSAILEYDVSDVQDLFVCKGDSLQLNTDKTPQASIIGSMKEYWRQTQNVIITTQNKKSK